MMESLTVFLAANGHAGFVWAAYGVAGLVLLGVLLASLLHLARAERTLARLSAAGGRRPRGRPQPGAEVAS